VCLAPWDISDEQFQACKRNWTGTSLTLEGEVWKGCFEEGNGKKRIAATSPIQIEVEGQQKPIKRNEYNYEKKRERTTRQENRINIGLEKVSGSIKGEPKTYRLSPKSWDSHEERKVREKSKT